MSNSKQRAGIFLIEILFFFIGSFYIYYTPLWTPADEERHFAYCEFIAHHHTLAVFKPAFEENEVYMAFHPPLYYLLGSLACDNDSLLLEEHLVVNDGPGVITLKNPPDPPPGFSRKIRSAYILRCCSLLFSGFTVWFVFKTAQLIFPNQLPVQIAAAVFVAMNPEFTHVSASITNDSLNIMLATASLYMLARFTQRPTSILLAFLCGLLSGCALMTKTTSLFLIPVVSFTGVYALCKDFRHRVLPVFIMFLIVAVVGGWWYARNWILFDDPFFARTIRTAHPWTPRYAPLMIHELTTIIYKTLLSYFGYFGGSKVPLPLVFLTWYGGITILGFLGCVKSLFSWLRRRRISPLVILYGIALIGGIGFFIIFNINYVGAYSGRYLFAVICPETLMIIGGVKKLIPQRLKSPVFALCSFGGVVFNIMALMFVLKPGYMEPRLHAGVCQDFFDYPSPEINISSHIGQTFVSPYNRLCGINIIFSNPQRQAQGTIFFTLWDASTKTIVSPTLQCRVKTIEDFGSYFFVFPPIDDSCGKTYKFTISTCDLLPGKGIALWCAATDVYTDGTMLLNDLPVSGDVYFIAYYFTGDKPLSIWEGIQPLALANGVYLDIWELQLYQERSKAFRQTTRTHKKFLQLKNAYANRNVRQP